MTVKGLFDFITDATITEQNMDQYLDKISENLSDIQPLTDEQIVDEEVFKKAYIPKTLDEVKVLSISEKLYTKNTIRWFRITQAFTSSSVEFINDESVCSAKYNNVAKWIMNFI